MSIRIQNKHLYRILIISIPLLLLMLLIWWALLRSIDTIDTVRIERGSIESSVTALGTLQPLSYVDIGAQVSGQITHIAIQPGHVVKQGDLLVEIDPSIQQAKVDADRAVLDSLHAQLAEAKAHYHLAQQENHRQQEMVADRATRLADVQTAEANLRIALARIANLEAQIKGAQSTLKGDSALLGYTRIYAPMGGTVVTLDAREGQTLNANYQTPTLLRIADLSHMTVWTEVSEADIGRIKPDMPVYFTTLGSQTEQGLRRWTGRVSQILPAPPNSTGQNSDTGSNSISSGVGKVVLYTVLFNVDNTDGTLMPQMSAQVFFIESNAKQVLVVPLANLQPIDGKPDRYTAQILVDGMIKSRHVHIGVHDRLYGEVLSGLAAGEQLVTGVHHQRAGAGRFQW